MSKAVFLDRDGTILVDTGYLSDPATLTFIPGVIEALKSFQQAGYLLIIVSNQSGIGRGLITEEQYRHVHEAMVQNLDSHGIRIDGSFYCPHTPEENCECRKPRAGMLLQAAERFRIDLEQSWMIGDKLSDILAGQAARCRTLLVNRNIAESEASRIIPDREYRDWIHWAHDCTPLLGV